MEGWDGEDRRKERDSSTCSKHILWTGEFKRHSDRLIRLEEDQVGIRDMLNGISTRQLQYISEIQYVKDAINNGLRKDISSTSTAVQRIEEKMNTFCAEINKRFEPVEAFGWFREWVTGLRDNMFKNSIKIVFMIAFALALLHFSQKIIDKLLG
jgi:hypothetical protein